MEISKYSDKTPAQRNKMKPHIKKMFSSSKREGLFPKQSSICNANMSCRRLSSDKNRAQRNSNVPFNPDPLNLSSLCDRQDGANSPVVLSPSLDRSHQFEPTIQPVDLSDPLNLNADADEDGMKVMCKRKKRKRRNTGGTLTETEELLILNSTLADPSDQKSTCEPATKKWESHSKDVKNKVDRHTRRSRSKSIDIIANKGGIVLSSNVKPLHFNSKNSKFRYGNFVDSIDSSRRSMIDVRLNYFNREWFEGKKCLDVGCNTGKVSILIAKHFSPTKVVGLDIDANLIKIAKRRAQECTMVDKSVSKYPISFSVTYGPILDTHYIDNKKNKFPENIYFFVENCVPESWENLDLVKPEYDCILCLNVTKWIQLNFGDAGLKRFFKKIYLLLQPGGKFIMEAQSHNSYKKRKNMVYEMWANMTKMEFMPTDFVAYLLSSEIGFSKSESLVYSGNRKIGSDQPIYLLTK